MNHSLFIVPNKDTYPPFKNGLYMEEWFVDYIQENNINTSRKFIPLKWTNFQIHPRFNELKTELQNQFLF